MDINDVIGKIKFGDYTIRYTKTAYDDAERVNCKITNRFNRWCVMFWLELKCQIYLLFRGMFRGECQFTAWNNIGKKFFIGVVTGSLIHNTMVLKRVFWCEVPKNDNSSQQKIL